MRDVPAGHVGGKTHGQRERPDQHADDLDRNQQRIQPDRHAVRDEILPVLTKPCAREPATMIVRNVTVASAAVTL